jgi:hypothetical protein
MGVMTFLSVIILISVAYVAYQQWLRHERRRLIHQERVAAIGKGVELPALDQELERRSWGVQRFLLLAGLSWISLGIGAFPFLHVMSIYHPRGDFGGVRWVVVPAILIGVSHLIVYAVERNRDR